MKIEEVLKAIGKGESQETEFKLRVTEDLGAEIASFANSNGGIILIGVNDKGEIRGCNAEKVMGKVSNIAQSIVPLPKIEIESFKIGGKEIVAVKVEKSKRIVSIGGIAYIRIGTSKKPLSIQEVFQMGIEYGELRFDEMKSPVRFEEAEETLIKFYFDRMKDVRGRNVKDKEKYLRSIKAVVKKNKDLYLTYGGLLFFHSNPQELLPQSGARIIWMDESNNPFKHEEFNGPIWRIADDVTNRLITYIKQREVIVGVRRERIFEYPLRSLREAVINALIHRNYGLGADTRIFLYKHKIIVRSPGSLVPGVDLEDPEHIPRNTVLCTLMYDIGYIENYGYGIKMMTEETKNHPITELKFKVGQLKVDVIFTKEKLFKGLDPVDQEIMNLLKEKPRSSSELAGKIGLTKPTTLKRLKKLMSIGLVKAYGRGNLRKYILS